MKYRYLNQDICIKIAENLCFDQYRDNLKNFLMTCISSINSDLRYLVVNEINNIKKIKKFHYIDLMEWIYFYNKYTIINRLCFKGKPFPYNYICELSREEIKNDKINSNISQYNKINVVYAIFNDFVDARAHISRIK